MNIGDKVYLRNGIPGIVVAYRETLIWSLPRYLIEYTKEKVDTEEVQRYTVRKWKRDSQLGITK
jgi:hypothetical protein